MPNADETLWNCNEISLKNVIAKGDYFGMNSTNIKVDGFQLVGNYAFDGGKNIEIRNAKLLSKDAFWNCENVTVYDSFISGEYLGWNSKNLTFVNCTIDSVMNPSGGIIRGEGIGELIMDETKIDTENTQIITGEIKYAV